MVDQRYRVGRLIRAGSCLMVMACLAAPPARAGEPSGEGAATLLQRGNEAFKEGRFPEAEQAYREALAQRRGYDIAGNLGVVLLAQGKHREAASHLAFTLRLFPITGDPAVRARMERAFARCREAVGAVRVSVPVSGAVVWVDGAPAGESPLADEVFVDPGSHEIEARLEGYAGRAERVTVEKGALVSLSLSLTPVVKETVRLVRVPVRDKPRSRLPAALLGAAGVVGVGVGGALWALSAGRRGEAESLRAGMLRDGASCVKGADNHDERRCPELARALRADDTFHDAAVGAFIVGGAALGAAAAYLFWPARRADSVAPAVRVSPTLGAAGGVVLVSGGF